MGKFPEANARLMEGKFACRKCKTVIKSTNLKIISGKVKCRGCKSVALRPLRKK